MIASIYVLPINATVTILDECIRTMRLCRLCCREDGTSVPLPTDGDPAALPHRAAVSGNALPLGAFQKMAMTVTVRLCVNPRMNAQKLFTWLAEASL